MTGLLASAMPGVAWAIGSVVAGKKGIREGQKGWQDKSTAVSGHANGCKDWRKCAAARKGVPAGARFSAMFSISRALAAARECPL
ncbi:hypothetical protein ACG3SL_17770 [Sphingomonas sp. CJ20]